MKVFIDDFLLLDSFFDVCLAYLSIMLKRCEEVNLILSWKNSWSKKGLRWDINFLKRRFRLIKPRLIWFLICLPTSMNQVRSFLGNASFHRRLLRILVRWLGHLLITLLRCSFCVWWVSYKSFWKALIFIGVFTCYAAPWFFCFFWDYVWCIWSCHWGCFGLKDE